MNKNWFFPALFLVLLALKLPGVIGWSWWWVTAPLWWPIGLFLVMLAGAAVICAACAVLAWSLGEK